MNRILLILAVSSLTFGTLPCVAVAAEPVQAVQDGLRQAQHFPWYDAEQDSVRPIRVAPYEPPRQGSDWEWASTRNRRAGWRGWSVLLEIAQYLVWGFLTLLFAALLFFLLRTASRNFLGRHLNDGEQDAEWSGEADRIEKLPFQVGVPNRDLLSEARILYQQRNYGAAIVYLFSYQLVQLDRHHWIRLARGKTNRQYLHELQHTPRLRQLMLDTTLAFEDVFFGHHTIDRERFETCWAALDEFHALTRSSSGAVLE